MAAEDDVRRMCLALPGVTERSSWDQPGDGKPLAGARASFAPYR